MRISDWSSDVCSSDLLALSHGDNEEALTAVAKWMVEATVRWCTVLENRPEIVIRRDIESHTSQLRDKRVLLFGCGALGSAIAECALRAGADRKSVVEGKRGAVRVDLGGCGIFKKKKK